jgi:hypothetical protein
MDALSHMLKEAGKLEKAGEAHGWSVKTTDNSAAFFRGDVGFVRVDCVSIRGQERISIWWENKRLVEAPVYELAGAVNKLRNASACVQQMAKTPDFEKSARKTRAARRRGIEAEEVTADPETLPWEYLPEDYTDADILRACYAKTVVWRSTTTGEVETDVVVRSMDAERRTGNFNSTNYHISRSSTGRMILNFLGVLGYRSVAFDTILRIGSSEEAARRTQEEMLKLARAAEDDKEKVVRKAVKRIG